VTAILMSMKAAPQMAPKRTSKPVWRAVI
jgi:hypothetical protein